MSYLIKIKLISWSDYKNIFLKKMLKEYYNKEKLV